jgi:hypothetical protein
LLDLVDVEADGRGLGSGVDGLEDLADLGATALTGAQGLLIRGDARLLDRRSARARTPGGGESLELWERLGDKDGGERCEPRTLPRFSASRRFLPLKSSCSGSPSPA